MAELKMMQGSSGYQDYLLIAEKDGAALGVKPISSVVGIPGMGPLGMFVGLRVRVAAAVGVEKVVDLHDATAKLAKLKPWKETFPTIQFYNDSSSRASTMIGSVLPRMPWQLDELQKLMVDNQVLGKFAGWLSEAVGDTSLFVVSPEDMMGWLMAAFDEMFAHYAKGYPKIETIPDDTPVGYLHAVLQAVLPPELAQKMARNIEKAQGPKLTVVGGTDLEPDFSNDETDDDADTKIGEEEEFDFCGGCGEEHPVGVLEDGLCPSCVDEEEFDKA